MRDMFEQGPQCFISCHLKLNGILFDHSKNIIDNRTMDHLYRLVAECEISRWIESIFDGEAVNHTDVKDQ